MIPLPHHLRLHDLVRRRRIWRLRIAALDLRQDILPLDNAAKSGVAAVKMRRRPKSVEELRATGILARMRHAQRPAKVLPRFRCVAFAIDIVSRSAATAA